MLNWNLTAVVWLSAELFLHPFSLTKNWVLEQWGEEVYVQLVSLSWDYEVSRLHEHRQNDCWIGDRINGVLIAPIKLGTTLDEGGKRCSSHKPVLVCFSNKLLESEIMQKLKKGTSVSDGFQEIPKSHQEYYDKREKEKVLQQKQLDQLWAYGWRKTSRKDRRIHRRKRQKDSEANTQERILDKSNICLTCKCSKPISRTEAGNLYRWEQKVNTYTYLALTKAKSTVSATRLHVCLL